MNVSTTRNRGAVRPVLVAIGLAAAGVAARASEGVAPAGPAIGHLRQDFIAPPASLGTRPLWFWNGPLKAATTVDIMERSASSGYAGFGILPSEKMTPAFMTPEFLGHYRTAVETAARLGLRMCLYDEFWFPSGAAGGELAKRYPEALSQRLDLAAVEVNGPSEFRRAVPKGKLMSAVALKSGTLDRVDLTARTRDGTLAWDVPPGSWKILFFVCVPDGARGLVDYLEPESVKKYMALTVGRYHEALAPHFGKTIDSVFYDEPTMHWVQGGRAWTPAFNDKFRRRYGRAPEPLYPALWFDIGPETAAARNALFGFRAELYADGFVGTLQEWCRAHGVALTGHQDQEEIVNPVGLCGDLMKCFRAQDIPGVDQVFKYGRASRAYKIVSSAAINYDRPRVMCECYGGIASMPVANLYKEAMDQFAKGVNMFVPHAVWYDPATIVFPPELSYRDPTYGSALPAYNRYMARLQRLLQKGRHVADIAVLYPIATLQAGYRFGVGVPYEGGVIPPEADYMDVGEWLSLEVRRDFTYIHPEVLDAKCAVRGASLRLENAVNFEDYRVLVVPGSRVIAASNLAKIKAFYDAGGTIIATTRLPEQSAEFGQDAAVAGTIGALFERPSSTAPSAPWTVRRNARGGRACFVPSPSAERLQSLLDGVLPEGDIVFEEHPAVRDGNLSAIHKVVEGRDVYFFANSSETPVDCHVRLRGKHELEQWDPHGGQVRAADSQSLGESTHLHLVLPPVQSRFFVAAETP
jgi:hypothetical protein